MAEEKPLWELGLGVAVLLFPAYRGSSETRNHVLPMPYFVYRGDSLKADRDGIRGIFFDSDRAEINLAASPPVDSGNITARLGMPDLQPSPELGVAGGPSYGSRQQHDYFYSVAPQYATAQRSAYEAKAGYAGTQFLSALWKRCPAYWVGGFAGGVAIS